jgi:hypothetical protein
MLCRVLVTTASAAALLLTTAIPLAVAQSPELPNPPGPPIPYGTYGCVTDRTIGMGFSEASFGTAVNPPAGYEKFFITIRKIDSVISGGVTHQYNCFSEEKAKRLQRDWEKGELNFSQGPYFIQECLANSELRIDISSPYNNFPYVSIYQARNM